MENNPLAVFQPHAWDLAQLAATLAAGKVCERFASLPLDTPPEILLDYTKHGGEPPVLPQATAEYYSRLALLFYEKAVAALEERVEAEKAERVPLPKDEEFPMFYEALVDWFFPLTSKGKPDEIKAEREKREKLFNAGSQAWIAFMHFGNLPHEDQDLEDYKNIPKTFYRNLNANQLKAEILLAWERVLASAEQELEGYLWRLGKSGTTKPNIDEDAKPWGIDRWEFIEHPLHEHMKYQKEKHVKSVNAANAKARHLKKQASQK